MSLTKLLEPPVDVALAAEPAAQARTVETSRRVFDLSGGRCAVEVVLAPFGIAAWRVRLQPAGIRIAANGTSAQITAHLAARPRYASVPGTAGLFMPASGRSTILAVTASVAPLEPGVDVPGAGVVVRDGDEWPVELVVRVRELDDEQLVASVRGVVHRRDDLPLPGLRLGIDAAVDLRRCA
jgi:hypothetical protein